MAAKNQEDARKKFEGDNKIESISGDQLYKWDNDKYQAFLASRPWAKEYVYA